MTFPVLTVSALKEDIFLPIIDDKRAIKANDTIMISVIVGDNVNENEIINKVKIVTLIRFITE